MAPPEQQSRTERNAARREWLKKFFTSDKTLGEVFGVDDALRTVGSGIEAFVNLGPKDTSAERRQFNDERRRLDEAFSSGDFTNADLFAWVELYGKPGRSYEEVLALDHGSFVLGKLLVRNIEDYNGLLNARGIAPTVEKAEDRGVSVFEQIARGIEPAAPGETIRAIDFPNPAGADASLRSRLESVVGPVEDAAFEGFILVAQEMGVLDPETIVDDYFFTNEVREFASRWYEQTQYTNPVDIYSDPQFMAERDRYIGILELEFTVANPGLYDQSVVAAAMDELQFQEGELEGTVIERTLNAVIDGVDDRVKPEDKVVSSEAWDRLITSVISGGGASGMYAVELVLRDRDRIVNEFRNSEFVSFDNFTALRLQDDMSLWFGEIQGIQMGRDFVLDPLLNTQLAGIRDPAIRSEARTYLKAALVEFQQSNTIISKVDAYEAWSSQDYENSLSTMIEGYALNQEGGPEFIAELKASFGPRVLVQMLKEGRTTEGAPTGFRSIFGFLEQLSDFGVAQEFESVLNPQEENVDTVSFLSRPEIYGMKMGAMTGAVKLDFLRRVGLNLQLSPDFTNGQITSLTEIEATSLLNARTLNIAYVESIEALITNDQTLSAEESEALINRLRGGQGVIANVQAMGIPLSIVGADAFVRRVVQGMPDIPDKLGSSDQLRALLGSALEGLPEEEIVDLMTRGEAILNTALDLGEAGGESIDTTLRSKDSSGRTLQERILDDFDDQLRLRYQSSDIITSLVDATGGGLAFFRQFSDEITGKSMGELEKSITDNPDLFIGQLNNPNITDFNSLLDEAAKFVRDQEIDQEIADARRDAAFDQVTFDASPLGQRLIKERRDQAAKSLVSGTFNEEFARSLRMSTGPAGVNAIMSVFGPSLLAEFEASAAGQVLVSQDEDSFTIPEQFLGEQVRNELPATFDLEGNEVKPIRQDPNQPFLPRELAPEFQVGGERRGDFDAFNVTQREERQAGLTTDFFSRFDPQEVNRLKQQSQLQNTRFQAPVAQRRRSLIRGRSF